MKITLKLSCLKNFNGFHALVFCTKLKYYDIDGIHRFFAEVPPSAYYQIEEYLIEL